MKRFQSELSHSYETYSFGYANYAKRGEGEALSGLYEGGYLPYSGMRGVSDTYYMARSVRVDLSCWEMNSENRRIYKKFTGLARKKIAFKNFNHKDESFLSFCETYFKKRHGSGVMPRERLSFVLKEFVTEVVEYSLDGQVVGYVFLISEGKVFDHFLFSFYDLSYINQSFGMWLMVDALVHAKSEGKKYIYLGTAYGEKGMYKTNYNELSFWNGESWERDVKRLKALCRKDQDRRIKWKDEWKEAEAANLFNN